MGKGGGSPTSMQVPLLQGIGDFPRQLSRMTMSLLFKRLPIGVRDHCYGDNSEIKENLGIRLLKSTFSPD